MERHKSRGSIRKHVEMRSRRGAHGHGAAFRIHLVVNETPLLQKGMDPMGQQLQETMTQTPLALQGRHLSCTSEERVKNTCRAAHSPVQLL